MLTPGALQATHPATLMGNQTQTKWTGSKSCHRQGLPPPGAATTAPWELSYHGVGMKSRGWETIAERTQLPVKSLSAPTSGGGPALPDDPTAATSLLLG